MRCHRVVVLIACCTAGLAGVERAHAQTSTVRWQLAPFCNVITVELSGVAAGQSTLVGSDDRCGTLAAAVPVSLTGSCQSGSDGQLHCSWRAHAPTIPFGPVKSEQF